eukprot:scaffold4.g5004.t1
MGCVGYIFFRSPLMGAVYRTTVAHPRMRWQRLFGLGGVALVFIVRTARQFSTPRNAAAAAVLLVAGVALLGLVRLGALLGLAAATAVVLVARGLPDDHIGHRAGAEGFDGELCENTVEALAALAAADAAGRLLDVPYVEFDVQETSDAQLVIFHDLTLTRAFPRQGHNAAVADGLERGGGPPFALATVANLSLAQLRRLDLGGRRGLRVPTLREFLEACVGTGVRRPLAIEVKAVQTDAARRQLLDDISWYRQTHGAALDREPDAAARRHPHLGWAGVIAFPHFFAHCFGEYGSPQWRHWAEEFQRRGIPARACHFTQLTLIYSGSSS